MRKILTTTALLLISAASFAQSKIEPAINPVIKDLKDKTSPTKPQYQKGYFVATEDLNTLLQLANERKQAVIYETAFEPAQAVNYQRQIDAFLKELGKRAKPDSIKVEVK